MNWITRLIESPKQLLSASRSSTPEGLWIKCADCGEALYNKELERSLMVCSKCSCHMRLDAASRAATLFDADSFELLDTDLRAEDVLNFRDKKRYRDRIKEGTKRVGTQDSIHNYLGKIDGHPVSASIFEFGFMGGSMGSVAGEKIVRGIERALEKQGTFLLVAASGGARMQEGVLSLMQMSKTAAAVRQLNEASLPFICLLTDPTMGGVSASIAWLGDVILAEPNALIGFAGPRVIRETVKQELPEGFQRAEFLLEHGLIDDVVDRRDMRARLSTVIAQLRQRTYH